MKGNKLVTTDLTT